MLSMSQVDDFIDSYQDWRGERLKQLRELINSTAPELEESFKWNVPVWSSNGLVCAISGFKDHVKINFFKGVYLIRTKNVFNSGLDSKEHRSINLMEIDKVPVHELKSLLKEAVEYNQK